MLNRKTLTKSLHTVTVVSRVADHLIETHPANLTAARAVQRALNLLGQAGDWPEDDATVAACIVATKKLVAKRSA